MGYGEHCVICGHAECRWVVGYLCEGKVARIAREIMPARLGKYAKDYRVSVMLPDFGSVDELYYVEESYKRLFGFLSNGWREVSDTRERAPAPALRKYAGLNKIVRMR